MLKHIILISDMWEWVCKLEFKRQSPKCCHSQLP